MSSYVRLPDKTRQKNNQPDKSNEDSSVSLNIRDTDFLLKTLMGSQFEGSEIEQAYLTMQKLSKLHRSQINES
jgi:uncharacterized protein YjbI with pentapeptide repeats